jgi:hypothetical protein
MKIRTPLLLTVTVAALVGATAAPAFAATSLPSDTTTTFDLAGGDLTLTTSGIAALGNTNAGDTTITGSLGAVEVDDARAGVDTWSVSAASTAFTGALATPSTSTSVTYTGGAVDTSTSTGTITVAPGGAVLLGTTPAPVVAPSAVSGSNTATWTPTLDVAMPAGAKADTYTGTVTTSIL